MARLGMDVDLVEEKGQALKADAERIAQLVRQIDALVRRLQGLWDGQDGRDFVNTWWPRHKQSLLLCVEGVSGLGQSALNNASDQRGISGNASGSSVPSAQTAEDRAWVDSLPRTQESWKDSMKRANPHYSDISEDFFGTLKYFHLSSTSGEYHNNCGYAATAYDLRRRGLDVTAHPDWDGDSLSNLADSFVDPATGKNPTWQGMSQESDIVNAMTESGPGSRAMVYIPWKDGNSHIFTVENFDGKVVFLDAQEGKANVDAYFADGQPGVLGLLRTDNCDIAKTWRVEAND